MPEAPTDRPARRDAFAPLLGNPLAALLREHGRAGVAPHAVPSAGSPEAVTRYDDGRRRINLGSNNYLGLAGDPRVVEAAAASDPPSADHLLPRGEKERERYMGSDLKV